MVLSGLVLKNFRNFSERDFKFSPKVNVILGDNATGKTNLLEAIFLLATGKSFKARVEGEMIAHKTEVARVKGRVGLADSKVDLEAILTHGVLDVGSANPEKVAKKKVLVGGVPKRLIDFAGNLRVVLFAPSDLSLVTDSPSLRRKFLDNLLSQVDREYRRSLTSYEKGMRQRNKLLFRIREERLSTNQLLFWNKLLIKNADYICHLRENFINWANNGDFQFGEVRYRLEYDKSAISEERLAKYARAEIGAAITLVGPHRDDLIFMVKRREDGIEVERELSGYGSRGEARMGVLWLKSAEVGFIKKMTDYPPVLLLDDIFSELDHEHREMVEKAANQQQTIITSADPHYLVDIKDANNIKL